MATIHDGARMTERWRIPDQLLLDGKAIEAILRRAVRHALLQHKRAGNTVAAWQDGHVVLLPAAEIRFEEEANEAGKGDESFR